jgi:hypothetical protein
MRYVAIVTLALCLLGAHTGAQATGQPSTRSYGVRGWFQGEEMLPWESELTVKDTAVDGGTAVHVHYRSRFVEGRWLFDDVAVWTAGGRRVCGHPRLRSAADAEPRPARRVPPAPGGTHGGPLSSRRLVAVLPLGNHIG